MLSNGGLYSGLWSMPLPCRFSRMCILHAVVSGDFLLLLQAIIYWSLQNICQFSLQFNYASTHTLIVINKCQALYGNQCQNNHLNRPSKGKKLFRLKLNIKIVFLLVKEGTYVVVSNIFNHM